MSMQLPATSQDELLAWVDYLGAQHNFNGLPDPQMFIPGAEGRFMPPLAFNEIDLPDGQPGSIVKNVIIRPRPTTIPLLVTGNDPQDLRRILRDMGRWLKPGQYGTLIATAPDGSQRGLDCLYQGGLEIREDWQNYGGNWARVYLAFYANYPFWRDLLATSLVFSQGSPTNFFPFTISPVPISSSGVLSSFSVDNQGDDEAWPIWIITGPGTNPQLQNLTSGENLNLTITLGSSDVLTIDCNPLIKTIKLQDGTSHYDAVADYTSALWSLKPGNNDCKLTMSGTTSASKIQLTYKRQWYML